MNEKQCAVVLMGPPGSGKTTVARRLATHYQFSVIETGNLLGAEVKRDTPLGREITPYKTAGDLVPSELVKRVIAAELEKAPERPVLFDGFPRSAPQVDLLFELLKERHLTLCAVIILNADTEVIMKRLGGRRLCQKCGTLYNIYANPPRQEGRCDKCGGELVQRPDDQPEVIRRRLENYERETVPIINLFRKQYQKLCLEVSAQAPTDEIITCVRQRLDATPANEQSGSKPV
jgi:adenylate kinase